MASVQVHDHNDDDDEKLANFTPPPQLTLNIKKDLQQGNLYTQEETAIDMLPSPLQIKTTTRLLLTPNTFIVITTG